MDVLSSTRMPSFLKPEISICTSQCKRSLGRSSHVSLIHTHLSNRDPGGALSIYHHMMMRGARPDCRTLPRVLTASRICGDLFLGKQLHGQAIKLGFFDEHYVITALIEIYGRLDGIEAGKWLFDKSPRRNSVAWTMILKLYLLENKPELAINVFLSDGGVECSDRFSSFNNRRWSLWLIEISGTWKEGSSCGKEIPTGV
ncbi:hypothetical protein OIU84_003786 [Salix udensis]|uniref:Pentatricopeptide repeat-containing protein n=1 Tax=Salix udensis TaxID=889485 RepID=A0AAD6P3K2_9ROSI|nr:hypothetical protein OIU84_003786 [Salix udensis]